MVGISKIGERFRILLRLEVGRIGRRTSNVERRAAWPLFFLRVGVGGVFLCAGLLKAADPFQGVMDILSFRLLPYEMAVGLAHALPWLEICAGILLIFHKLYSGALTVLGICLAVFILALGSAWWRGLDISCGCFGASRGPTHYFWLVSRDAGLMIALLLLAWRERQRVK